MGVVAQFYPLRPVERLLWNAVDRAADEQCSSVAVDAAGTGDETVRSDFLAWLLTCAAPNRAPRVSRVSLTGADVEGRFDLRGGRLALTPRFVACCFAGGIALDDAALVGFELIGGDILEIVGDRAKIAGSLAIRAPSASEVSALWPECRRSPVVRRSLRLNGATIAGNFDLRGCTILGDPASQRAILADGLTVGGNGLLSDRFKARAEVRLGGCRIGRNLDFSGAKLHARETYSLFAKGSQISGSLYLCRTKAWSIYPERTGFRSIGMVALEGARIDGDLDCSGGFFLAPGLAGRLISTTKESDDDLSFAINAAGVVVRRDVLLCDGFWSKGVVCLINSRIESDLQCSGAYFDYPRAAALASDGVTVAGTTFFDDGSVPYSRSGQLLTASRHTRVNGSIDLLYGSFRQGVQIAGLEFAGVGAITEFNDQHEGNCGLDMSFASIGGKLLFKGVTKTETAKVHLDLYQAKIDLLEDDESSWSVVSFLNLSGCEYKAIKDLRPDAMWRLALLDRHYGIAASTTPTGRFNRLVALCLTPLLAFSDTVRSLARSIGIWVSGWRGARRMPDPRSLHFEPQPYLQLAKIIEQSGYADAAVRICIRLEGNLTRLGDFGFWKLLGRYILAISIRYGYRPSYAVCLLLIWTGLTWLALVNALPGQILEVDAKAGSVVGSAAGSPTTKLSYSPFFFALDTLVPIVDLHQKSRWTIQPPSCAPWVVSAVASGGPLAGCRPWIGALTRLRDRPLTFPALVWEGLRRSAVPLLGIINPFLGWALTSLFVAGVSGLVRRR